MTRLEILLKSATLLFFGICIGAISYSYASIHREMKLYGMTSSAIEADKNACEEINKTKCKVIISIKDTGIKL